MFLKLSMAGNIFKINIYQNKWIKNERNVYLSLSIDFYSYFIYISLRFINGYKMFPRANNKGIRKVPMTKRIKRSDVYNGSRVLTR